jgi:hypothetical protein
MSVRTDCSQKLSFLSTHYTKPIPYLFIYLFLGPGRVNSELTKRQNDRETTISQANIESRTQP